MKASGVLITGTTSGIGLALLEHYVRCGAKVVAVNRRRVPELEARYPSVRHECVDVRNTQAVAGLLAGLHASGEMPDVLILNAGINRTDNDQSFQLADYRAVLDTNLYGVLNFVEPLLQRAAGKTTHVIAISSLARYVGNPYGLGYYTSKQALTACFEVWSKMYAGTDVVFQQVMLGPVPTQIHTMADEFPRWMVRLKNLFSGSPAGSARAIARFASSRRSKLFYPARAVLLYWGMWLGQAIIPGFFQGKRTLAGKARRPEAS
jgi:NAD(P)-dependent dehydrogenase (short-subunit alcohol dehydrogenase family)